MSLTEIDTSLDTALTDLRQARDNGTVRELLQSFTDTVSRVLHVEPPRIDIETGAGNGNVTFTEGGWALKVGHHWIKQALDWEVTRGESAVFGALIRVLGKNQGMPSHSTMFNNIRAGFTNCGFGMYDRNIYPVSDQLANLGRTIAAAREINQELPGVRGALAASFLVGMKLEAIPEATRSKDLKERLSGYYAATIMETLIPGSVPPEVYQKPEAQQTISEIADFFRRITTAVRSTELTDIGERLARLVKEEPDEDEGGEGEGEGGEDESDSSESEQGESEQGEGKVGPIPSSTNADDADMEYAKPEGTIQSRPPKLIIQTFKQRFPAEYARANELGESPWEQAFRDELTDVRLEVTRGQRSGRLVSPRRAMTDRRPMARRAVVQDPPDAAVVFCLDRSGSMAQYANHKGYEVRSLKPAFDTRWSLATKIHDAAVFALTEMEVETYSLIYDAETLGGRGLITMVNAPGQKPIALTHLLPPYRENADLEALMVAGDLLDKSGKRLTAIVFLADGEFRSVEPEVMRRTVKADGRSVLHVDFINSTVSPFGGLHIRVRGLGFGAIAKPLAKGLATALDL